MSAARSRANARVALLTAGVAVGMVGLAFASVPLYRLFCQVTGYGGTPQRAEHAPEVTGERTVTVRDRDSLEQVRVAADKLVGWVRERLA